MKKKKIRVVSQRRLFTKRRPFPFSPRAAPLRTNAPRPRPLSAPNFAPHLPFPPPPSPLPKNPPPPPPFPVPRPDKKNSTRNPGLGTASRRSTFQISHPLCNMANDGGIVATIALLTSMLVSGLLLSLWLYASASTPTDKRAAKMLRLISGCSNMGNAFVHVLLLILLKSYTAKYVKVGIDDAENLVGPAALAVINCAIGVWTLRGAGPGVAAAWNSFVGCAGCLLPVVWPKFMIEGLSYVAEKETLTTADYSTHRDTPFARDCNIAAQPSLRSWTRGTGCGRTRSFLFGSAFGRSSHSHASRRSRASHCQPNRGARARRIDVRRI